MGASNSTTANGRKKRKSFFFRDEKALLRQEIQNFYKSYKVKTPPLGKGQIGEL